MSEHRTLEDFGTGSNADDRPDAPKPTYRWVGSGEPCGGCGETVETLWQGDYGLVCAECKDW